MIDFSLSDAHDELRQSVRRFIETEVLPLEASADNYDEHENISLDVLKPIREKAKQQGLWAPQCRTDRGGLQLPLTACAAFYEEANRSIFGPVCLNCAAPDDGNMRVLELIGTEQQKTQWLQPIVDGDVASAFAMTEPHPGGGSDPGMINTKATLTNGVWRIKGRKWFITGAGHAHHFILMARTSDDARKGLTAFLFHRDQPGWHIERRIPIMGPEEHGGHCEIVFDGLEIKDENRLLEVGDGLKVTQMRLGPARLTHCMRWLGLAKRCMEIANEYVQKREGFGVKLGDRESVQLKLGELAHDIQVGRLLVMHAAWKLDAGDYARKEVSSAKIHVANTLHKAADTGVQLCGARGYSKDTPLEWIYRYARQARLVDGADEVHKMVLSRFYQQSGDDFWQWGV